MPPGGSAAEGRRGLLDDRGMPPGGSAAEGRRGLIDDRGVPPGGSTAEGRRGLIDRAGLLEGTQKPMAQERRWTVIERIPGRRIEVGDGRHGPDYDLRARRSHERPP
jgi:hypothetical protein